MKCPGQDSRYWRPGAIFEAKCPKCGKEVEFFKDEATRTCKACGHRFLNPSLDFGCASYCQFAEQCIGNLPPELLRQKEGLLKERLAIEVKKLLGKDFKKIGRAGRAARYAEQIGREEGANLAVVIPSVYLMQMLDSDEKASEPSSEEEEKRALEIGRILSRLGAKEEIIRTVSLIVSGAKEGSDLPEFRCARDASLLAGLEDVQKEKPLERDILQGFATEAGKRLAGRVLGFGEEM